MKYRPFGKKMNWQGSALGFGAMRLPQTSNNPADVDEAESIRMVRHAIDNGVNYVDTAYPYHAGKSEVVIGKALLDGYHQKVKLATKLPPWSVQTADDFDKILDEQMKRLQTDVIDLYLLHGLNNMFWPKLRDLKVFDWAEKAMASGRIGKLGFSFHDEYSLFKEIVDAYDNWTFCQIQYNYMDTKYQAGTKGLKYAAGKGLAVVVMEPLRGGSLAKKPPEAVAKIWAEAKHQHTLAEWALLWIWEHPEVSLVLSGMSKFEQVVENLAVAEKSGPGSLTEEDFKLIERAKKAFKGTSPIPCTNCGYCMPCQQGVEIPRIFQLYNNGIMYDDMKTARFFYHQAFASIPENQRADQCIECGECEEACPQKIPIAEWLKKVHKELGPR
ncbi:MAG: aldo/keto reductase [Dehalococcoidia bacterium]|jgi:predicted aldo/keto reductase-like oxidoreductase